MLRSRRRPARRCPPVRQAGSGDPGERDDGGGSMKHSDNPFVAWIGTAVASGLAGRALLAWSCSALLLLSAAATTAGAARAVQRADQLDDACNLLHENELN